VFALEATIEHAPDTVLATGRWQFRAEWWGKAEHVEYPAWLQPASRVVSGGSQIGMVYHSLSIEDPTIRDLWRAFRDSQWQMLRWFGPMDHIYLENYVIDEVEGKKIITFVTGS